MAIAYTGPLTISYMGNGVTTIFAVPWPFFQPTDVKAWIQTAGTPFPVITPATGWAISGTNAVFVTAPPVGQTVILTAATPETQPAEFVPQSNFPSATAETAYDRVTMLVQQLKMHLQRAFRLPPTDAAMSEIPVGARANTIIGFDVNGNPALIPSPVPIMPSNFIVSTLIVTTTGGGTTALDGLDAGALTSLTLILFNQTGIGLRAFQLQFAALPTGPNVVTALNLAGAQWVSVL